MAHDSSRFFQVSSNIRVGSSNEIVEIVPYLVGFHPSSSLVLLGRGPEAPTVGRTLCCPLDVADDEAQGTHERLAAVLADDGMTRAFAVVFAAYGGEPEPDAARPLAGRLGQACSERGVAVEDFLYVCDERLWSLICDDVDCCPPEGRPVRPPGASQISAALAYAGVPVIPSRAELRAMVDVPDGFGHLVSTAAFDLAHAAFLRARDAGRLEEWRCARIRDWEEARDTRCGRVADPALAVRLIHSLFDMAIRDHVCSWAGDERRAPGLRLLCQLARATPSGLDLPTLTVVAWLAWACDDRALAMVAIDLALARDAGYRFACVISDGLRSGLGGQAVIRLSAGLQHGDSPPASAAEVVADAMYGGGGPGDADPTRSLRLPHQRRRKSTQDGEDYEDGNDEGGNDEDTGGADGNGIGGSAGERP